MMSGRAYIREVKKNLWALPAGQVTAMHACTVSSGEIEQLLSEAKRRFDVILIDTGPILGSVEASVFAQQADGVVLVVSRGQQPSLVERATKHLRSINARVIGAVFNRAARADFYRSFQPSSISAADEERIRQMEPETPSPFGPLVQAMADCTPTGEEVREPAQ
jgi:Mrp family chromosome partitioning ATPase